MSRRPSRNFSHASKNGNVTGIRLTKLPGTTTTSRKNTIGKSCTFENKSVLLLFSSFESVLRRSSFFLLLLLHRKIIFTGKTSRSGSFFSSSIVSPKTRTNARGRERRATTQREKERRHNALTTTARRSCLKENDAQLFESATKVTNAEIQKRLLFPRKE